MNETSQPLPTNQTIEDLRTDIFLHSKLSEILEEVQTGLACAEYTDQKLLIVTGPTGVGKTTVGIIVERTILEQEGHAMKKDPAYTPVLRISAAKPAEKKSVWKELFEAVLNGFNDILVYRKSLTSDASSAMRQVSSKETTTALKRAIRNQIRERRTNLLIIDETQHLLDAGQGRTVKDNIDVLKSLSTDTGVRFLLIGPYELPMLINRDGQLIRRSNFIHFRAYGATVNETAHFLKVVRKMEKSLPLPLECIPTEFLIFSTLRYVGLLKELLLSATLRAMRKNKPSVGLAELQESARSVQALKTLWEEQRAGELLFKTDSQDEKDLRSELGLVPAEKEAPAPKRKNSSPGIRASKRDPLSDDKP